MPRGRISGDITFRRLAPLALAIALAACHGTSAPQADGSAANAAAPVAPVAPAPTADLAAATPDGFVPLQSPEVKDAIHRALTTGQDQRWQDGAWSGYAVPSRETLANGCRTVRYTIDQQPNAPAATINACDAGKP
ncbi:hypothetical protein [Sphingomonas sp.]|uniref:hypothetical protein n=1 Tax=Sphingomonas sp. TaxID=28214 RepID=UPI003B3AE2A8